MMKTITVSGKSYEVPTVFDSIEELEQLDLERRRTTVRAILEYERRERALFAQSAENYLKPKDKSYLVVLFLVALLIIIYGI